MQFRPTHIELSIVLGIRGPKKRPRPTSLGQVGGFIKNFFDLIFIVFFSITI